MTDVFDAQARSRLMGRISGSNTLPERVVRAYLHRAGLRFRLHRQDLPGRPDIVLPRYRTVVMVHGCFWHRHQSCRSATTPSTRAEFWADKFASNVRRDTEKKRQLEALGWRVLVIWECETRDVLSLDSLYWRILAGEPGEANAE